MKFRAVKFIVFVALLFIPVAASAATSCEALTKLAFPSAKVDSAAAVAAGSFGIGDSIPNRFAKLPAFCRVTATLTPTSDSDIKVEIWMPVSGWNGKFQAVGNGGWAGSIPYTALAEALGGGYATAGTD